MSVTLEELKSENEMMYDWMEFGRHVFGCPDCYDNLILNRNLELGGICPIARKMLSEKHIERMATSHTKIFIRQFNSEPPNEN